MVLLLLHLQQHSFASSPSPSPSPSPSLQLHRHRRLLHLHLHRHRHRHRRQSSSWCTELRTCNSPRLKMAEASTAQGSSMEVKPDSSLTITEHSELLQAFYQIPSIDKAWLFPSKTGKDFEAMLVTSEVNVMANSKRKYQSFVNIPKGIIDKPSCNWSAFPVQLSGVSLVVPSKSGNKLLIIRNGESGAKDKPNPTKLEIWNSAQLLKEIVIPASVHGPVYTDGWFEGVAWSLDESHIAYVAEDPIPKRPVYGNGVKSSDVKSDEGDLYTWKGQGDWQEDWGEAYTGKQKPGLFVTDIQDGSVQKVTGIPDDLNVGQVIWAPSHGLQEQQFLVFVGWPSASENFRTYKKLGIKYCFNRPCALYAIEVLQKKGSSNAPSVQKLPISLKSAFLPRFSPRGDRLVFLSAHEAVKTGVHDSTNSLHSIKWPVEKDNDCDLSLKEVVPVKQPRGTFPGLYCKSVIGSPWLLDNETIVLSSSWFSSEAIIAINTSSGKLFRITPEDDSCWNLLSIHDDHILAVKSNFAKPPSLQLGVPKSLSETSQTWAWFDISNNALQLPPKVEATLKSINYDIIQIPISDVIDTDREQGYESIFVSSKTTEHEEKKRPLVVVVHGGPHSVYTTSFSRTIGYLVGVGLNLLLVNYRGSLGFGEETLQSLPGKVGQQDVQDVLRALDYVISKGLVDPKKVAVTGGSHGGFLSTHLIGQAPDRFVTAAVRNPVCNISSMVGISDIPDWCYVETYGQACFEEYTDAPTPGQLEKFYKASPISHIKNVKVPTLFLLGAQDRRVPISNGFQYVHALKARGLKVKVIVFPEDMHPIDRPQSEFESWINIGTWLLEHLV